LRGGGINDRTGATAWTTSALPEGVRERAERCKRNGEPARCDPPGCVQFCQHPPCRGIVRGNPQKFRRAILQHGLISNSFTDIAQRCISPRLVGSPVPFKRSNLQGVRQLEGRKRRGARELRADRRADCQRRRREHQRLLADADGFVTPAHGGQHFTLSTKNESALRVLVRSSLEQGEGRSKLACDRQRFAALDQFDGVRVDRPKARNLRLVGRIARKGRQERARRGICQWPRERRAGTEGQGEGCH
jgi:hypothetical protein